MYANPTAVRDLETADSAPELNALGNIGDEQLGNEIGVEVRTRHTAIVSVDAAADQGPQYASFPEVEPERD